MSVASILFRVFVFTGLSYIFFSCANQMNPTGGPKDETPPQLVYSIPADKTLNFKGNIVELRFDEVIQVSNLKNELIITPTYPGEFDFKQRKYGVIIEFDTPFGDSTTYTLNFRDAIVDITESNPAENLKIAFSTWDFLDSLSIEGNVKELLTDIPSKEFLVGIYAVSDTLNPFNGPPLYFSKTDENGDYTLNNIKSGNYFIFAYNDKNNNLIIDSRSEKYGFLNEPLSLDSSLTHVDIGVLNLDITDLVVQSARQNGHYYEIKTSKSIIGYDLITPHSDSILHSKIGDDRRTIVMYNTFHIPDSLEVHVTVQDSLYAQYADTVFVKYEETRRQKDEFKHTLRNVTLHKEKKMFSAELEFTKPVETINFDSLYIEWDTVRTTLFDTSNLVFEKRGMVLKINRIIEKSHFDSLEKNQEKPKLILKPASIVSIEKDSSLAKSQNITMVESKNLGIIRGSVNLKDVGFIIQLIDNTNKVVQSINNQPKYVFDDVPPGTYKLRLLIDENNDGVWHPGNILDNIPPEPVLFYSDDNGNRDLILRANWELTDIDVDTIVATVENGEEEGE